MASLEGFQTLFENALKSAPSYLVFDGFYVYKTEDAVYNPVTDSYGDTETASVIIKAIRGSKLVDGTNRITFLAESRPFTSEVPTANGALVIDGTAWNILSITSDPIGLTYLFTVENKDGT